MRELTWREFWGYIEHDRVLKWRLALLIWVIVGTVAAIVVSFVYW